MIESGLLLGVSHILTEAPYFILACALLWPQRRYSGRVTALAFGSFIFAHGASDFILTSFYSGDVDWVQIQFTLCCVITLALVLWMFRISFAKVLYTALLLRAIYTAILYIVLNAFMLAQPGRYIGFDQTPLFTLAAVLSIAAVYPFLWRYFTGRLRTAFAELDERIIRQLCVSPALFFLLDQCYSAIRDTLEYESIQTAAIFILMLFTGIATYYVNLRMVQDSVMRARRESELTIRLALQAQSYERLTENITQTRAARHDLRHHLSVIAGFTQKNDNEGLLRYIDEYTGHLPEEAEAPLCLNHAVDIVVRHYLSMASSAGAETDVRLKLPANAGISDSDLCIVFGNVFENAAKSVAGQTSGKKFITARCDAEKGRIVLTVDNSISEAPPKRMGEGLGLLSVTSVAEKYGGGVKFERDGDVFHSSVMLPVNRRKT